MNERIGVQSIHFFIMLAFAPNVMGQLEESCRRTGTEIDL